VSAWAGKMRQTRPVVICGVSRPPKRAASDSEAGPAIPGGGRTPPLGLGGTMADGAIDGGTMVGPDGKDEPPLGASCRDDISDDGNANWAAAVPGHPIAPNTRAASILPAA
jgi:hypothetical protein